jgi:hypothetical protein
MKRLFAVCLLMLCLSFPAFGGHTLGGGRYCECTPVNGTCPCCSASELAQTAIADTEPVTAPADPTRADSSLEFEILIVTLLLWLRLKA